MQRKELILFSIVLLLGIKSVDSIPGNLIQRSVLFLTEEVKTLREKWEEKIRLWTEYNSYRGCLEKLDLLINNNTRQCLETKKIAKILERLETITRSEQELINRIISKTEEIFPSQIILLKPPNIPRRYHSEKLKTWITNILRPVSSLSGSPILRSATTEECKYFDNSNERKWTLKSTVERCTMYTEFCYLYEFILLPNGNILDTPRNIIRIFSPDGILLRNFSVNLPTRHISRVTYWRDNKILVLCILGDYGEVFEIDLEAETARLFTRIPSINIYGSSCIRVVGETVYVCGGNGILYSIWPDLYLVERRKRVQTRHGYHNARVYVYPSDFGSDYAVFASEMFHYEEVLLKSTGEIMCTVEQPRFRNWPPDVAVSRNGIVVLIFYEPSINKYVIQAYDTDCYPVGDFLPINDIYMVLDMHIRNNSLVLSVRPGPGLGVSRMYFITYTFSP